MAKIEGFRVINYRSLRDITMGKLWNTQNAKPLTPMTAVIGKMVLEKARFLTLLAFLQTA